MTSPIIIQSDSQGFIIGQRQLREISQNITGVQTDIQSMLAILQAQSDAAQQRLTDATQQLANSTQALADTTRQIINSNRRTNGPTPEAGQSDPNPPQPPVPPAQRGNANPPPPDTSNRLNPPPTIDVVNGDDSTPPQRDSRGRYTRDATDGNTEQSRLDQLGSAIGDAVSEEMENVDTRGADPIIDSMHELNEVIGPGKRAFSYMGRGAMWLFRRKKPEISPEQDQANQQQQQSDGQRNKLLQKLIDAIRSKAGSVLPPAAIVAGFAALAPVIAAVLATALTAYLANKAGNAINDKLSESETGRKIQDTAGKLTARTLAFFGNDEAQAAVEASDKAADAERYKDRPENPFWGSNDGVYRFARKFGLEGWMAENQGDQKGGAGQTGNKSDIKKINRTGAGFNELELADGSVVRRDGDRNWRNNNPGNIEYGKFAKSNGAIGGDGRFAIFPSYEAGKKAKEQLIFGSNGYKNLDLKSAISRYAPPTENDTARYQRVVLGAVGGQNKRMSDYTPEERKEIMAAMEQHEGMKKGKVTTLKQALPIPTPKIPDAKPASTPASTTVPQFLRKPTQMAPFVPPVTMPKINQNLKIPALPREVTKLSSSDSPKILGVPQQANVSQNIPDRHLAHIATGGMGMGGIDV